MIWVAASMGQWKIDVVDQDSRALTLIVEVGDDGHATLSTPDVRLTFAPSALDRLRMALGQAREAQGSTRDDRGNAR